VPLELQEGLEVEAMAVDLAQLAKEITAVAIVAELAEVGQEQLDQAVAQALAV
jgi:hypothetical protein